ncbi:MAG: hypothetical protein M3Q31_04295 [Actinomycetota bacterium]|nr:hypothetical protein [Actinomycetota bacterium]
MLVTESGQVGMFDAAVLVRPLPEGSFFGLLAEHGRRIVRVEDFAECYSQRMGRPSIRPSLFQGDAASASDRRVGRAGDGGGRLGFALEGRARAGG